MSPKIREAVYRLAVGFLGGFVGGLLGLSLLIR